MMSTATQETVEDRKFERGVRRLQEMKADARKQGRVTFYVQHGKVSELEMVERE